jgi:hypothetical protein
MKEWRTPVVEELPCHDADAQRSNVESWWLRQYIDGRSDPEDLLEAMRHMTVDLIEAGYYPSRHMLRMWCGDYKALCWPDQGSPEKERRRSREWAWLDVLQGQIEYLAATKFCNEPDPKAAAERAIAGEHKISVRSLHRKRDRYRLEAKKSAGRLRQRRARYAQT